MHADVELSKDRVMYHYQDMEEYHKDPEMLPTFNLSECPKTLETVEGR